MLTFGIFFLSFTWRVVMESMHWSTDHHFLILFMTKRLMSHALGSLYASVRSTPLQRNYSCLELASCLHWQISYLEREESVKGCYGALTQGTKSHTFMLCGRFTAACWRFYNRFVHLHFVLVFNWLPQHHQSSIHYAGI